MKLTIKICNYKSIAAATFEISTGLNILVGPNGAGKTCILSALKFMRDLLEYGVARAVARAGGPRRVLRRGSKSFEIEVSCAYGERVIRRKKKPLTLDWRISVNPTGPGGVPMLATERISIGGGSNTAEEYFWIETLRKGNGKLSQKSYLADSSVFGRDLFLLWESMYRKLSKEKIRSEFVGSLRSLRKEVARLDDEPMFPLLGVLDRKIWLLHVTFRQLNEYNIVPEKARQATEPVPFPEMRPDGQGVAEVLFALESEAFSKLETFGRTVYFFDSGPNLPGPFRVGPFRHLFYVGPTRAGVRSLRRSHLNSLREAFNNIIEELTIGVAPLDGLTTDLDPTTGKRFVVFKSGDDRFYPEEVSDGTVKWLCILVSVFVPSSRVFVLEEPENFLHPWMQQRLVETMRKQAAANETIYLLTSHSTTVLNSANVDEVLIVTGGDSGSKVSRVPDREEVESLLASSNFGLGDLWESGGISGVPGHG